MGQGMIHIGQSQEITCVSLLLSFPSGAIQTAVSTSNIYLQQCVAIFMEYSQSGKITQALVSRIFFFLGRSCRHDWLPGYMAELSYSVSSPSKDQADTTDLSPPQK